MKRFVLAILLLIVAHPVVAQGRIYVGAHHNYVNLRFNNPNKLEGWLTGVKAGVEYDWCCLFGDVNFEGYWSIVPINGNPCQRSDIEEYFVKGKVGFLWSSRCWCVKPYTGFGWNYFENEQDPESGGLAFRYEKLFIPVGFIAHYALGDCLSIGLQGEWRPDVYSKLRLTGHRLDVQNEQAFRVELPIDVCFRLCGCCTSVSFIPFYDWNRFGKVKNRTSFCVPYGIPELTRWDLGLRLIFNLCF